jgi:acyl-CoA hydrolase
MRLVAQVTWVGRSSLEVAAAALTLDHESGAWTPCLTARFVVVRLRGLQTAETGSERTENCDVLVSKVQH